MEFSWKPFFNEVLDKILGSYNKTTLAELAVDLFGKDNFNDQFKDGTTGVIREIDPLTFIAFFNRGQTDENRKSLCIKAKEVFQLKSNVPSDFNGIPIINNQRSWFFPFDKDRNNDEIDSLWEFSRKLNDSNLDSIVFKRCLAIKNVKEAKLTQLAFIVKPNSYYPLDKFNLDFLERCGVVANKERLSPKFDFNEYVATLDRLKEKFPNKSFAELSHDAKEKSGKINRYWVLGAMWGERQSRVDKTDDFVRDGEWICGYSENDNTEHAEKTNKIVNEIQIGDWVAIKSAFVKEKKLSCIRIKAVGLVTNNSNDGKHLKVNWLFKGPSFDVEGTRYMETVHEVTDQEDQRLIFNNSYKTVRKNSNMESDSLPVRGERGSSMAKNLILYGPPGTGKTYNSVNKAVALANPDFDQSLGREAIKGEYDRLVKEERIVFTTFHQSMSYEDFIEGIKPVEPEKDGDPLNYKIELGIFRRLCIEASFEVARSKNTKNTKEILDFSIIYDKFIDDIESKIGKKEKIELKIKAGGTVLVESISSQSNILIKHHGGDRIYTVSKSRLAKLYAAIPDLNTVENINNKFREIIGGSNSSAYWAVLNAIRESHFTFDSKDSDRILTFDEKREVVSNLTMSDYKNTTAKPYVLIVDEINRGNVAQIFGELISLIEDSKRLGQEEAIEAVLPYSKERFGIPDNLFIVGTMNTADRSVEALDTALRRRFSFEEMSPKPEELEKIIFNNEEIDLVGLLKTINKRIEKLLNKDHLIGHSFFLDVKNISDLKAVFGNKIIPLLQEYFYGDFGKIGLVLGSLFVNADTSTPNDFFAIFDNYEAEDLSGKPIYTISDVKKMDDKKFKLAVDSILRK